MPRIKPSHIEEALDRLRRALAGEGEIIEGDVKVLVVAVARMDAAGKKMAGRIAHAETADRALIVTLTAALIVQGSSPDDAAKQARKTLALIDGD